ncbi:MAG: hypothetical protein P8J20_05940 [Novosphingobium sp.]|nr:hypothetical protein [Novosphingobium sp.]
MNMHLEGTPSDQLPDVLATGLTPVRYVFLSLSAREPDGRDAEYLEWHAMDHRPEQYRLANIRNTLRLVSTPACRAARAASEGDFDRVDHVMNYLFSDDDLTKFTALGGVLDRNGRMPLRLPSVGYLTGDLAGKVASAHAVAGSDVIPWRPCHGVYLIFEQGQASPEALVDLPGVAGVWWYHGAQSAEFDSDAGGLQVTYCYLDEDPVECAEALGEAMRQRWASGEVKGMLAAPFYSLVPFEWERHVP